MQDGNSIPQTIAGENPVLEPVAPKPSKPLKRPKSKGKYKVKNHLPPNRPQTKQRKPNASGSKKRALCWDHFTMVPKNEVINPIAACNYYGKRYLVDPKSHWTSNLNKHLKSCLKFPYALVFDPNKKLFGFELKKTVDGINMTTSS